MLEGSRTPGPRRVSDAAPQARVASPKAPANGRSTAKSKPSDAERRKRVHYRRLLRHLGELEGFATGLHPHGRADHVSFEAFASNLRALASGLQELPGQSPVREMDSRATRAALSRGRAQSVARRPPRPGGARQKRPSFRPPETRHRPPAEESHRARSGPKRGAMKESERRRARSAELAVRMFSAAVEAGQPCAVCGLPSPASAPPDAPSARPCCSPACARALAAQGEGTDSTGEGGADARPQRTKQ